MNNLLPPQVATLGLFERRVDGDDALMELARLRFQQAAMGAEMHAGTPEHLEWLMRFRPSGGAPVIVHLPREFNLADEASQRRIVEMASRFAARVSGMVLHDHATMVSHRREYLESAWKLDDQLERIEGCPTVFVEYAVGLEPRDFAGFFAAIPDLDRIAPCIDTGHVGIRQARAAFARSHGGQDVCALKSQSARVSGVLADVEAAVAEGAAAVLSLVETIGALKKPVHFHLHDAHPLSTISPFGVSDHLSFLTDVPLNFESRRTVVPMFGPAGLAQLVGRAVGLVGARGVSFTLEIHPTFERLAVGDAAASLFAHWTDQTNAERMNHWLWMLGQNHELLRQAIGDAVARWSAENAAAPAAGAGTR